MRNGKNALIIIGLALTTIVAQAHTSDTLVRYFLQTLYGHEQASDLSKKIKINDLEQKRAYVWEAWKKANAAFEEERLIDIGPLQQAKTGQWHLPESLEPHAIMSYYWGAKGEKPQEGYPVFIYLHGSGPRDREWSTGWQLAQMFEDAPSLYFIPRIPNERDYYRWWQKAKQYAWNKLLRQLLVSEKVDPDRFYLFGISEGGYGSQRLASFYADYFAAVGPMAGGEPLKNAPVENCRNIGFSMLTGAKDFGFYRNILTQYTKDAFDKLQIENPGYYQHRIELIPDRGHSIDYRLTTPWLSRFKRNPYPKQVSWEDFEMDGFHRKGFYNIVVNERPDSLLRTHYEMDIKGNDIEVTVSNVRYVTTQKDSIWGIEMKFDKELIPAREGSFTLFLDEHLVDLKKRVTLVVNGRKVFQGKLTPDLKNMLRSLAVFGDPRRIYPVAIEVKLKK